MKQLKSAPHSHPVRQVALDALFLAFLKVSLCGCGGGLFWARRVVVEQRQWMDDQEFAETLTLCQLMPGPNIVGVAVCSGAGAARRDRGYPRHGGLRFLAPDARAVARRRHSSARTTP